MFAYFFKSILSAFLMFCGLSNSIYATTSSACPMGTTRNNPYIPSLISSIKPIPKSKGKSLLFGDYPDAQRNLVGLINSLWAKYGTSIVELDVPFPGIFQHHYAILTPPVAQAILLDNSGTFVKGAFEKRLEKNIFSPEGIIFMDANARWKSLNKALFEGPLNPNCFPACYTQIFQDNFEWFMDHLSAKHGLFELYREVTYFTMRTMAQALFNYTLADDELITVTDAFAFLMNFMYNREMHLCNVPLAIPLPSHRIFYSYLRTFNAILAKIIKEAPDDITVNNIQYPTIIGILKNHRDPVTHTKLTYEEIQSQVATLFFAAHDTTTTFITMQIYHLSITDIWYKQLRDELLQHLEQRPLSWFPLDHLKHYTNFKNEILRLYPSLPVVTVNTTKDVIIDNYLVPKDSVLCIGIEAVNTHPEFYKNPHTFNPHRFNPEDPDYTNFTQGNQISFIFGFRRCIGQWFAQAEAQMFVHLMLLHNITFDIMDKDQPIGLSMKMTGMPNRPILTRLIQSKSPLTPHDQQKVSTRSVCNIPMKIIDIRCENDKKTVKTYRLAPLDNKPCPFSYYPGEHIEITAQTENKGPVMRHYSLSSSPTDSSEWIEITIKKEECGLFSDYMHTKISCGDQVLVRAPMDDGVRVSYDDNPARPLILISGGIGITPMISITRYLMAHNWQGELYFIHSNKSKQDLAFTEELIDLARHHKNLHLIYTFTKSHDVLPDCTSHIGRINTDLFDQLAIKNIADARVYLCGTESMCADIQKMLHDYYTIPLFSMRYLSFGTPQATDQQLPYYTLSEVALHNKRSDAWIVIDTIVYDITDYVAHHPGLDIILDYIGTDASQAFHLTPHSAEAKKLLNQSEYITIKGFLK